MLGNVLQNKDKFKNGIVLYLVNDQMFAQDIIGLLNPVDGLIADHRFKTQCRLSNRVKQ